MITCMQRSGTGRLDDSPIAKHFSRALPNPRLACVLPGTDAAYGIMIRKGNVRLRDALNGFVDVMEREGTLEPWFE